MLDNIAIKLKTWAQSLRRITGDDAYERYLQHHQQHHFGEAALDRRAFYLMEQQRKWSGVKRCC
jgi:uncharacterized short protein YbdD (DUF466 family)